MYEGMFMYVCVFLWVMEGVMRREPRETGGGDGVGSAPLVARSLFSFGGSVILKI